MILRALVAAVVKDFRLLLRDKVGLIFLTIAPLIVMSVAGFSLSTLFGGAPQGDARYVLPVVDEDGGDVAARAARRARRRRRGIEHARGRQLARRRSRSSAARDSGAALVVPAGTRARARARRQDAALRPLHRPRQVRRGREHPARSCRSCATASARRRSIGRGAGSTRAREQDRSRPAAARATASRACARASPRPTDACAEVAQASSSASVDAARKRHREASCARRSTRRWSSRAAAARERAEHELGRELAPVRGFVDALTAYRGRFETWIAAAREAGRQLRRSHPAAARAAGAAAGARVAGARRRERDRGARRRPAARRPRSPCRASTSSCRRCPPHHRSSRRRCAPPPEIRLPRLPGIEETSVSGAPQRLNSFDQYVPGFSITFLMLGMLLGVAMTLIDELELGTLERIRATQAPVSTLVIGKLIVRFVVGVLQMVALLAVGHYRVRRLGRTAAGRRCCCRAPASSSSAPPSACWSPASRRPATP